MRKASENAFHCFSGLLNKKKSLLQLTMFVSNFTYDHGAFGSTAEVDAMILVVFLVVVKGVFVVVVVVVDGLDGWMVGLRSGITSEKENVL